MKRRKITDKSINYSNYANFAECSIIENGQKIRFIFNNGDCYEVPVAYVLGWFDKPHYQKVGNRFKSISENSNNNQNLVIIKCRRVLDKTALRVYTANNYAYDIVWDTVLMACEPLYEHFGGLTKQSKKITKQGLKKYGPFYMGNRDDL